MIAHEPPVPADFSRKESDRLWAMLAQLTPVIDSLTEQVSPTGIMVVSAYLLAALSGTSQDATHVADEMLRLFRYQHAEIVKAAKAADPVLAAREDAIIISPRIITLNDGPEENKLVN